MKPEIFVAEIDLSDSRVEQKMVFRTEIIAYLSGLSAHYDEALVISHESHLLLITVGQSPIFVINVLSNFVSNTRIFTSSAQNAVEVFMSIAKGKRWTDISLRDTGRMITSASRLSMESDCFGNTLRRLVESALFANARCRKKSENFGRKLMISKPSIAQFDIAKISPN